MPVMFAKLMLAYTAINVAACVHETDLSQNQDLDLMLCNGKGRRRKIERFLTS